MPLRNLLVILLAAAVSIACYWRASRNRYVDNLTQAMNLIESQYVDEVELPKLYEGAMEGMVDQLDPYSGYTNPADYEKLLEDLDQEFGGIGIQVEVKPDTGRLTVMNPLPRTPAYEAGLKAGDVILSIGGQDTKSMTINDAVRLMRGKPGEPVTIGVLQRSSDRPIELTIKRAIIPIESVYGDLRKADGDWTFRLASHPEIGYIRIATFGERTSDELRVAIESLRSGEPKLASLVIDLRGNAGGLLRAAIETCDMFLNEGRIVSTNGRGDVQLSAFDASSGVEFPTELPIVVLVDQYSASASEIVAACLQDHDRAVICGQRSWGKGTVQNVIELGSGKNRSAMRLTVARYQRPSGKNIHKKTGAVDADDWGVRPNPKLEVNLTDAQFEQRLVNRRSRDLLSAEDAAAGKPTSETVAEASTDVPATIAPQGEEPPSSTGSSSESETPSDATSESPSETSETKPAENQPAEETPAASPKTTDKLPTPDPFAIDPQLAKAIAYLQSLEKK
ncbi:carboxyl-terminal protease [Pirellula staleyi DSM 6068]|uniref:Carboxyl-terminal protease n=1 Tax=Pirellula staleyi (strain ATCC 27377 / DSM 6068 / ICPB 4128) TaxID=530564 RepID=D2R492_PIRSD|nr:S41 family peptidase [Pirellula staleyi]ADB15240.1 carboxyl-terminal protease [Pirellula staleyi DSM 6068]